MPASDNPEFALPLNRGRSTSLPDPELNPTTNPVLAANLGRWAQVYFTTPPEKREQAVRELLQELKATTASSAGLVSAESRPQNNGQRNDAVKAVASPQKPATSIDEGRTKHKPHELPERRLICPACLHKNEAKQRFCGFCGFLLTVDQPPAAPAPVAFIPPEPRATERDAADWTWLHEKNRAEFTIAQKKRSSEKYLIVIAALLVLLLIVSARWWKGERVSSAIPATPRNQPMPNRTDRDLTAQLKSPTQRTGPDMEAKQLGSTPAERNTSAAGEQNTVPPKTQAVTAGQNSGTGKEELEQGRRYLEGRSAPKDTARAASWLWKAVSKKNVDAALLLSDLYVRGDGVSQSCDQARVLLRAALEHGSSAARERLKAIENSCR